MRYVVPMASVAVAIVIAASLIFLAGGRNAGAQSGPEFSQFTALSHATSDQCAYLGNKAAIYNSVDSQSNSTYFQGSCCSPMSWAHYQQQIAGLKNYSGISAIPQNPYNVSVAQVRQLLGYYDNITLNASQAATYNQAAPLTQDKGWCCCQCWAWYAHAGLARYMIKNYGYNASQVAKLIDLEDCCGG